MRQNGPLYWSLFSCGQIDVNFRLTLSNVWTCSRTIDRENDKRSKSVAHVYVVVAVWQGGQEVTGIRYIENINHHIK